ncbi:MAG: VCBS repeat-containing protein [Planctomycetes bacterium]|nr:VCBS repeat-containing protein [Planctomycetota bacterium]
MKRIPIFVALAFAMGFTRAQTPEPYGFEGVPRYLAVDAVQNVITGFGAPRIAVADLDGDGDLDLLRVRETETSLDVIHVVNGVPVRVQSLVTTLPSGTQDVVLADWDGDSVLDAVVLAAEFATQPGTFVCVFPGRPDGTFAATTPFLVSARWSRASVADLDGDGRDDLLLFQAWQATAFDVLFGGSTSGAVRTQRYTASSRVAAVHAADLDGDGDQDVVAGVQGGAMSVYANDGLGNLTAAQTLSPGGSLFDLVLGDLDGDGDVDVLASTLVQQVGVEVEAFPNDGTGRFGTFLGSVVSTFPSATDGMRLRDVDADGVLDLVTALSSSNYGDLLTARGNGALGFRTIDVREDAVEDFDVFDLDGDGRLDVVTGDVRAIPICADGSFFGTTPTSLLLPTPIVGVRPVFLDANGDRATDVVTVAYDPSGPPYELVVQLADGSGGFLPEQRFTVSNAQFSNLLATDLNADGFTDVLTVGGGFVVAFLSDGQGGFSGSIQTTTGPVGYRVGEGDLDGDSLPDFVLTDRRSGTGMILYSRGDGTFDTQNFTFDCAPGDVWIFDANGDGLRDVVYGDRCNGLPSVAINLGSRAYAPIRPLSNAQQAGIDGTLAQLDGHGPLELVTHARYEVAVFQQGTSGAWNPVDVLDVRPFLVEGLLALDLDRDGRDEIVLAGDLNGRVSPILANTSASGTPRLEVRQYLAGRPWNDGRGSGLADIDYDADGFQDLALEGWPYLSSDEMIRLYPNRSALRSRHVPRVGNTAPLGLNAPAAWQFHVFAMFPSAQGSYPGVPIGPGMYLPLNYDSTLMPLVGQGGGGVFENFFGLLGTGGDATARIHVPSLPELRGFSLDLAFLVLDAQLQPAWHSNVLHWTID